MVKIVQIKLSDMDLRWVDTQMFEHLFIKLCQISKTKDCRNSPIIGSFYLADVTGKFRVGNEIERRQRNTGSETQGPGLMALMCNISLWKWQVEGLEHNTKEIARCDIWFKQSFKHAQWHQDHSTKGAIMNFQMAT